MRTYKQIESSLLRKIDKLKDNKTDFSFYIGDNNGNYVDVLYFGYRELFTNNWIFVANDIPDDFSSKDILVINPEKDVIKYKEKLKSFISKYGLKSCNYYTFEEI